MAVAGGRLVSRSMDNRLGSYVALEAAAALPRGRAALKARFAAVAAVQEEIGLFGSRTAAFTVRPGPRGRDRRHPRHRRTGRRREGGRQPPVRLRPGDRPRLDPVAEGLRTAARTPQNRPASRTRSAPAAMRPTPTPTRSRSRGPGSRPAWSRSRCATCTRRSRWSTWPMSRPRSSWSRPSSRRSSRASTSAAEAGRVAAPLPRVTRAGSAGPKLRCPDRSSISEPHHTWGLSRAAAGANEKRGIARA